MVKIQDHITNIGKSPTLNINETSARLESQGQTIYKFGFGQSPFKVPNDIVKSYQKTDYAAKKMQKNLELEDVQKFAAENDFNPDIIGISGVVSTGYSYVKNLSTELKKIKNNVPIVLGGPLGAEASGSPQHRGAGLAIGQLSVHKKK